MASDPVHDKLAYRATMALGSIRPRSLPALLGVMTNYAARTRYTAACVIGDFGTNALPAVPLLIRCLNDPDRNVTHAAASTLGQLALMPNVVLPALTNFQNPAWGS